jgi:hypothetical protein
MPGAIVLLSGASGSGKTTLCREALEAARAAGRSVAGILSPARFAEGSKSGIDALDPRTGESRPLASRPALTGAERAPWRFEAGTLAWGDGLLATATPCDLLVVDELGPLEWLEGRGWTGGLVAADSGAYACALVVVRPSLLERARARWPAAAVVRAGEEGARARLLVRLGLAPVAEPRR